jgi:HK97 family phage prohead protease
MPEVIQQVKVFKSYRAETKELEGQDGMVRAIVSTEAMDRDGEVIKTSAWGNTIKSFMNHPVLISSHEYNDLTRQIGEWVSLEVTDKGLEGVAKYYIDKGNAEADWGYELAKQGKAAYSVGFMAYEFEEGKGDNDPKRTYTNVELLEISQVTIPSNRESLVTMRSKGIDPIADEIAAELFLKDKNESKAPVPDEDKFSSEAEAEARADEIGCEGTHSMDENGNTIYMPCSTHDEYDEIVNPESPEEEVPNDEDDDEDGDDDGYEEKGNLDLATFTKQEKQQIMNLVKTFDEQKIQEQNNQDEARIYQAVLEGVRAGLKSININSIREGGIDNGR